MRPRHRAGCQGPSEHLTRLWKLGGGPSLTMLFTAVKAALDMRYQTHGPGKTCLMLAEIQLSHQAPGLRDFWPERSCRMNTAAGRARRLSSDTGASIASNRGRSGVSSASSCSNSSRLERHAGDQKASGHVFEEPRLRCFRSKDSASRTSLQAAASSSPGFKSESAPGTSPCQSPSPSAALCLCWRDSSARAAKLAFFRAMYLDSSTLERTPWTSPSSSSTPPTLQFKGGGCGTEDKSYATSTGAAGEYSILCGFGGRWPCRIGQASLCLAALAFQETGEIFPTRGAHRDCHVKGERYCNSSRPVMSSHRSQTGHYML